MKASAPGWAFAAAMALGAAGCTAAHENVSCGTQIVSSSVESMYCGRRVGNDEMLELLVLWRGTPGWFHFRRGGFGHGGGGGATATSNIFGMSKGRAHQYAYYGDVAIGIDADFDRDVVKIGEDVLAVSAGNVVFVDGVDVPGGRRITGRQWLRPKLPATGDPLLLLAQRSPEVRAFLRCGVPMPQQETTLRPELEARLPKVGPLCDQIAK